MKEPIELQSNDGSVLRNMNGTIWVPDSDVDLQVRLCVIDHTGPGGHRADSTTSAVPRQVYPWSTGTKYVNILVETYIPFFSTIEGGKLPHPHGPAVHGTASNKLQFKK